MGDTSEIFAGSGDRRLKKQSIFVFSGLLLWSTLELAYRAYIVPNYEYAGFIIDFSMPKYGEGLLIYILLLLSSPYRWIRPSDFFVNLLLFGLVAPLLVYYALTNQPRYDLYFMVLAYVIIVFVRRAPRIAVPVIKKGPILAYAILIAGVVSISTWLFLTGFSRPLSFDLLKVYEYRAGADAALNQGFMAYLNNWCYKVFGPSLLAIALWKRIYWLAGILCFMHLFWFGVSQHKSVLFFPLLVIFIYTFRRTLDALCVVPLAIAAIVLLSLTLSVYFDSMMLASLIVRRVFFVTANNVFYYYEFFSQNGFVYWSNSVFATFLDYPYDLPPAKIIGMARGLESHANTSFIATGYMHAGILGVGVYAVVVGLLFRLIDALASKAIPAWLVAAVLITPMLSLFIGADLFAAMLTHGMLVALLILLLLRKSTRTAGSCEI